MRVTLKKNGLALRNPLNGNAIHIDRLHTKRDGHMTYSYAYLDGQLIIDPKEEIIVRKTLKLHQSGLSKSIEMGLGFLVTEVSEELGWKSYGRIWVLINMIL